MQELASVRLETPSLGKSSARQGTLSAQTWAGQSLTDSTFGRLVQKRVHTEQSRIVTATHFLRIRDN